ncbi:MAG: BON domain-containing protein, partial [Bdellovibrio sp.]|nr:BON domain-containing protein [Bdellovibrio sp.]
MTSPYRGQSNRRRRDWYERDPMDERSGYRDESSSASDYDERTLERGTSARYRNEEPERWRTERDDSSYEGMSFGRRERARERFGDSYETERWNRNEPREYNRDIGADFSSSSYSSYGSDYPDYSGHDEHFVAGQDARVSFAGRGPKGYSRSDDRIKEDVSEALTRHARIDASDIEIEVKNGEVTLTGTVTERRMKHMAEDLAEKCSGVKDVINHVRVKKEASSTSGVTERHGGVSASGDHPETDSHLPTDKAMLMKKSIDASKSSNH